MKKIIASKMLTGQGYVYTLKDEGQKLSEAMVSHMEIQTVGKDPNANRLFLENKFEGIVDFSQEQVQLLVEPSYGAEPVLLGLYGTDPTAELTFNDYQENTDRTALYKEKTQTPVENLYYVTLGLVGEAGEIANKVKKVIRDQGGDMTEEYRQILIDELGDVLWYSAQLATLLEVSFADAAQRNLDKLFSRKERGTLTGDGDKR